MLRTLSAFTLALIALGVAACSSPAQETEAPAQDASVEITAETVTSGTFTGASDHVTTGQASIVGTPGNYTLVFAGDFSLDGAPDPIVGFGNNGTFDPATKLGALINKTGAQSYSLPADFDPANAGEVYVWCEQFSVPLGVAALN